MRTVSKTLLAGSLIAVLAVAADAQVGPGGGGGSGGSVTQGTTPWVDNIAQWGGTVLGGATTWGTAPTGFSVPGANVDVLASPQVGATGSAVPVSGDFVAGKAQSSEPAAASTGNLTGSFLDLTGKGVTSPYANRESMVRGSASATGTGATTLIAAGGASVKTYITDIECGRTDTGTTASRITLSDAAATVIVLPNSGGGGGNSKAFNVPLVTAANTAFTFTSSASISTVYCSAQGFTGY